MNAPDPAAEPWSTALLQPGPRLFDFLLESAGDGIFEWDLVADQIRYSRRWKMLLGYEESQIADVPASWRALSHPDDLPGVDQVLREHLESLWPFAHAWRMRHHNGDWRWILCRATAERDERDVAVRLFAVFTDISDQVAAEERQKALVRAVPDLMLRLRRDGVVLDEKQAAVSNPLLGAAVVGQPLAAAAGGNWPAEAVAAVCEAVTSGLIIQRECVAPDEKLFLELRAVRSGPDEAVCIVRDITERRLVERRQHQLQAQIAAILQSERQRLADELDIARHIQTALLPKVTSLSSLDVCSQMWPASEVGGDYFDLLPCEDGAWLAIGDVSGHGVNGGMIMLMIQSAIASLVSHDPTAPPSAILRSANRILHANIRDRMQAHDFVTCTLLRYWSDGRLLFAGAHEDILVCRATEAGATFVPTSGVWLGVMEDLGEDSRDTAYQLHPGDLLMLYTDGITEARNASDEQFGAERLAATVLEARDRTPAEIRDHVRKVVQAWAPQQEDDQSLVIARQR